jgi:hypothetical protein
MHGMYVNNKNTHGYVSAFPVCLVLMLPSDLSPKKSHQTSALAERMVADDSAVSENDKSGLARWELFTYCAIALFFLFKRCIIYSD